VRAGLRTALLRTALLPARGGMGAVALSPEAEARGAHAGGAGAPGAPSAPGAFNARVTGQDVLSFLAGSWPNRSRAAGQGRTRMVAALEPRARRRAGSRGRRARGEPATVLLPTIKR